MKAVTGRLLAFLLLLGSSSVPAATRTVTNTADAGAGSLRDTIVAAVSGDTVDFAAGLSGKTITMGGTEMVINKDLVIDASALARGLTIDADGESRIFSLTSGKTVDLLGLTLTGGRPPGANSGGAILNLNSTLTLTACTLFGNTGPGGGGAIFNDGRNSGSAILTLNACTLAGNAATSGAGGAIASNGDSGTALVIVNASTISGNYASGSGGGILSNGLLGTATVTLTNSILAGNHYNTAGIGSGPDLREVNGATASAIGKNLLSDTSGSTLSAGGSVIVGAPLLAPLGEYGGPSPTMPPLAASPAIDSAGGTDPGGTDQRGFSRFVNGLLDIGAVEVGPVTLVDNAGDGAATATTLRKALADTATTPGAVIRFDPAVFDGQPGDVIKLSTGTQLEVAATADGLFIDASNIATGITLDADATPGALRRVLALNPGAVAAIHGVTFTGGMGLDDDLNSFPDNSGGGIYNDHATLMLNACTLFGNSCTQWGGGVFNNGLAGIASLALNECTLTDNHAGLNGGAIYAYGQAGVSDLSLNRCTVSGNSAAFGGGLSNQGLIGSAVVILDNTILAGNTGGTIPDYQQSSGTTVLDGKVLLSDVNGSGLSAGPSVLVGNPVLAPLGSYGGPTATMPPLSGSPAIGNGGTVHPGGTDQRGFPRFVTGSLDLGAVELGPVTVVNDLGDSAATATTLRKALADTATTPGAVIRFDGAVFAGDFDDAIRLTSTELVIPGSANGLFIEGSNVVIDADAGASTSRRVFNVLPGAVAALHGLHLTGGNDSLRGGAIYNDHASLTLIRCTVSGNNAGSGGGILIDALTSGRASLALNTCTVTGNRASTSGGGLYCFGSPDSIRLALDDSTVSGNIADYDGGIYAMNTAVTLSDTILAGNSARVAFADILVSGGSLTVDGSALLSDLAGSGLSEGPTVRVGDPLLAPLGDYGGPLPTMPPLANSPAIDVLGGIDPGGTDQRGFPRFVNGARDLGAVEIGPVTLVDNTGDDLGTATTLRKALFDVGSTPGAVIRFDPAVFDGEPADAIALVSYLSTPVGANGLYVDASNITGGITLDASGVTSGISAFYVGADGPSALHGITITGAVTTVGIGGAMTNLGQITLNACRVVGNSASYGAGIANGGSFLPSDAILSLNGCTLEGNSASLHGGAIYNVGNTNPNTRRGIVFLTDCTLDGNTALAGAGIATSSNYGGAFVRLRGCTLSNNTVTSSGGGIASFAGTVASTLELEACTLGGNTAQSGGGLYASAVSSGTAAVSLRACTVTGNEAIGSGGGIFNYAPTGAATLALENTILAGNTAASGPDLIESGGSTINPTGVNLLSDLSGSSLSAGPAVLVGNPMLAPLGDYGGPTLTCIPVPGSPAIDAAGTINPGGSDQRGFARYLDGDGAGGSALDIGAVEVDLTPVTVEVTHVGDAGEAGTLRSTIQWLPADSTLIFNGSLLDQPILLSGNQINITRNLTIDASALERGMTIDGGGLSRIFNIAPGTTVSLNRLTLTGGYVSELTPNSFGGAIYTNRADLTLDDCTLSDNFANYGGALYNAGFGGTASLVLNRCSLTRNRSYNNGGAILTAANSSGTGSLTLNACTLSGNTAGSWGGAVLNSATTSATSTVNSNASTLSGNVATGAGGGIYNNLGSGGVAAVLNLENTLVAGNLAPSGPDLQQSGGSTNLVGNNLFADLSGSGLSPGPGVVVGIPRLAPLSDYGGLTRTRPPLAGCPSIDAGAAVDPGGTDQRGFPRFINGALDIGAVELGSVLVVDNAGDNEATATTLRHALAATAGTEGTVIRFDPAVFNGEPGDRILVESDHLFIPGTANGLLVDASDIPEGIILDANAGEGTSRRVLVVGSGATAALHGLTITGGRNENINGGGGIRNDHARLTLNHCTVSNNRVNPATTYGGGIFNEGSSGGSATLILNTCTVAGNSGVNGGGIYNLGQSGGHAVLELNASTVSGNAATYSGGGILSLGALGKATVLLNDTIVAANTASNGSDVASLSAATPITRGVNLLSDTSFSGLVAGPTVLVGDAKLSPLGHYGGPRETLVPLAGSPAIDAAGATDFGDTDQRGFARMVNGARDIGAVELGPVTLVNNLGDSAATATTLRKALLDNATTPGAVIRFDPAVFTGQPDANIVLTGTHLDIAGTANGLLVDASDIPGGVTIDADGSAGTPRRAIAVNPGGNAALQNLSLTGGHVSGVYPAFVGGAVFCDHAHLTLNDCNLSGNTASFGGGLLVDGNAGSGAAALNGCTLSANTATSVGGAAYAFGASGHVAIDLRASTLAHNSAAYAGGLEVYGSGSGAAEAVVEHCTFAFNSGSIRGGGIDCEGAGGSVNLRLADTILSGNASASGPELAQDAGTTVLTEGTSLLGDLTDSGLVAGPGVIVGPAVLAPLGDYGGRTPTMPPLANSPAIDASSNADPSGTDQRGFPRRVNNVRDIGAVELGTVALVVALGDSAATPTTLRKALLDTAATPGAVIRFDTTLFNGEPADTINLGNDLNIVGGVRGLLIDASNVTGGVTIDAGATLGSPRRVFKVQPGASAALHGLTLTGGVLAPGTFPDNAGGAVLNDNAILTLNACHLLENSAVVGGGLYCNANAGGARTTLNGCALSGNRADYGGGINNNGGVTILNDTVFTGNSVQYYGGGIHASGAAGLPLLTLNSCSFSGNAAVFGGGIFTQGTAGAHLVTLNNCVGWNNGDSVYNNPGALNALAADSSRNLLQGATVDGVAVVSNADPTFVRDPNAGDGNWTTTGDNDYGDLRLLAGSPALDTGDSTARFLHHGSTTDHGGLPRFHDDPGTVNTGTGAIPFLDLGAFEGAYTTFATLFPALDPNDDDNLNGIPNFQDYAMGADPGGPYDSGVHPILAGTEMTFGFRAYALDVLAELEKSSTLQTGSWSPMVEGSDFAVKGVALEGGRFVFTIELLIDPLVDPRMFFRQVFTATP